MRIGIHSAVVFPGNGTGGMQEEGAESVDEAAPGLVAEGGTGGLQEILQFLRCSGHRAWPGKGINDDGALSRAKLRRGVTYASTQGIFGLVDCWIGGMTMCLYRSRQSFNPSMLQSPAPPAQ